MDHLNYVINDLFCLVHLLLSWQKFVRDNKWNMGQVHCDEGSMESPTWESFCGEGASWGSTPSLSLLPLPFSSPLNNIMFFFSTYNHLVYIYILVLLSPPINVSTMRK